VITMYGHNGPIGTVSLAGGKLEGSTSGLQHVADHMLGKHGSPQKAFRAMATMNNGYVWAGSGGSEHARDDLAAVIDLAATATAPRLRPTGSKTPVTEATRPLTETPPHPKARPRLTPLTPMRQDAAKSMTKLADDMRASHPEMSAHQHVRDAARMLRAGHEEAAQRHLRGAMFSLSPQSVMRHGIHTDDGFIAARQAMHSVHRHLLLVKDIEDVGAKNRQAIARHAGGDDTASPPLPAPPVHADPNAGYGPGALAQKPTQRQPGGDRALNAPDRTNSGGSDPAVADPVGPQPRGSKQFAATWDELADVLELSAETGRLAVTPAPYGKPGGPGLYGVKGNKHSDYEEQIVQALMRKGMDKGKATAIARGSIRKWMVKSKHPEVRAAAGVAEGQEIAAQARAHAHARTWDELGAVIDLAAAAPPAQGSTAQARVPKGQPGGGEFAPGQTTAAPTDAKPVGSGASGKPVSDLQARLNALGAKPPLKADGTFGPATLAAVKAFQKAHGLKVDGLVGPLTTAALRGKPPAKKAPAKK